MDEPKEADKMNKTSTVGRRIEGSVVGLLAGGMALGALLVGLFGQSWGEDWAFGAFIFFGGLGFLGGGIVGAAVGATVLQRGMKQSSSFWDALAGAVVGLVIGVPCALTGFGIPLVPVLIVAGAVIGSGGKDEPGPSCGTQGVISADTVKQQPGQAKCPFCHSTTFRVEEDVGSRRCSDCHSVLPNYIQGNG
jgi:hypothetical protein